MAKSKFYVVWQGRETGIFTDWPTTQKLVAGYPGAKHKSFESRVEAEAAFAKGGGPAARPQSATAGKPRVASKVVKKFDFDPRVDIHIFCDGGCDPNPGKSGSGVAVYGGGKLISRHFGLYHPHGTNNTAELNALHQSMLIAQSHMALGKTVQIRADSTYAIKCMTTWAADWQRRGWARKTGELANAALIASMYALYQALRSDLDIQHIKAHSGYEGNELADRLSMLAIRHQVEGFGVYDGGASVAEMLAMASG